MGCPASVVLEDNLVFSVACHDPDTGVLTDADAVPSYRVYEDETATPILTGNMAKLDDANTTGFYTESIACTAANGFESGKTYTVYIEATVDSDKGGITYGFKVETKTGFSLAATGLDSVAVTRPSGIATTFPEMVRLLYYRFFGKATRTATTLTTYAANGTTAVTTQTISDDNTTETQGEAS